MSRMLSLLEFRRIVCGAIAHSHKTPMTGVVLHFDIRCNPLRASRIYGR